MGNETTRLSLTQVASLNFPNSLRGFPEKLLLEEHKEESVLEDILVTSAA
jgi:hypothetical protein